MKSLWLGCVLSLFLLASFGFADVPPTEKDKKDQGNPPSTKQEAKDSPRLQKLKQLTFDRRPSAILKAWAPQPPSEPKADAPKPDPLDKELEALRRNVTLGRWGDVKTYLAGLPKDEAKAGYEQMLRSLRSGPPIGPPQPGMPMMPPMMQYAERNRFSPDDLIGLAAAAPLTLPSPPTGGEGRVRGAAQGLDKDTLHALGAILSQSLELPDKTLASS